MAWQIRLGPRSLFRQLVVGHVATFLLIGFVAGLSCFVGEGIRLAEQIRLPGGITLYPHEVSLMGLPGFLLAMLAAVFAGAWFAVMAWLYTRLGLRILSLVPGIDVEYVHEVRYVREPVLHTQA